MTIPALLLLHGIGTVGGILAKRLRTPAGYMIGAMLLVTAAGCVIGDLGAYPPSLRLAVQLVCGMMLGSSFTKQDIALLRTLAKPAVVLMASLLTIHVLFAWAISSFSALGLATALFAAAPGGVSDLAILAADFGADAKIVALLQLVRFVFVLSFFPAWIRRRLPASKANVQTTGMTEQPINAADKPQSVPKLIASMGVAAAAGLLFYWLHFPAGAVIGAMIGMACFSVAAGRIRIPVSIKRAVQICCGCYIGKQITRNTLLSVNTLAIPIVLIITEVLAMAFVTSFALRKITKMEQATSLFSSIPGGIAEMGIIAEELGLDTARIAVMNTCRVILTICFIPFLMRVIF